MVKVQYRSGSRIVDRMIPVGKMDDLRRIREYIEHFDEIRKGEYRIGEKSKLGEDEPYPMVIEETVKFEQHRPRYGLRFRVQGSVVLKDGAVIQGEFLPDYDDEGILIDVEGIAQRVPVDQIERIRIVGSKKVRALGTAIRVGVGGATTGALIGALAAWQSNADIPGTAVLGATIFGVIGFVTGLFRGASRQRRAREFVLGPVERDGDRDEDEEGEERRGGRRR